MQTAGRWPRKLVSSKECVTTHLQNHTAPKTDGAQAVKQSLMNVDCMWHDGAHYWCIDCFWYAHPLTSCYRFMICTLQLHTTIHTHTYSPTTHTTLTYFTHCDYPTLDHQLCNHDHRWWVGGISAPIHSREFDLLSRVISHVLNSFRSGSRERPLNCRWCRSWYE